MAAEECVRSYFAVGNRLPYPPDIIRRAIWLYARFALSFRDEEEMPAERRLDVSYETIGRWFLKFGFGHRRQFVVHPTKAQRSLAPRRDGHRHTTEALLALARSRQ